MLLLMLFFFTVVIIALLITIFFVHARPRIRLRNNNKCDPASVLVVVGSGGHTTEILTLVKALGEHYSPRYYIVADTDQISEKKIDECEKLKSDVKGQQNYKVFYIPRSREVKQSYLTSVITTLRAIIFCFPLVFKLRPEIILCNGPGTCIPVCLAGMVLKCLRLQSTVIVYVESFCRVTSLSLSGKLLYHLADSFFVQWPELLGKYPKAKYVGRLV
ncbi:UDP-N-acetylglucosamine transferase subunit ALG14 homolog [Physella acuta]|uniref:UDP-N-acetylglucosamine transferase subunit ALG14 homolog n=1 Tax=Physella acuta TaxID=109671 RepID=UPI0027DE0D4E|nr:UDP-N-acetylglucosamine transferase subunit ALG14 homolog [Physella acuta]